MTALNDIRQHFNARFYKAMSEGQCVGAWADGQMLVVDSETDMQPFDLCVVVPRNGSPGDGYDAIAKIFLGQRDDKVLFGTLNPPEAYAMPVSEIAAMHKVVGSIRVRELTEGERTGLERISGHNTGDGIAPINSGWRPAVLQ